MPTFMRYVAFLSTDMDFFFFLCNRQNIQKNAPLFVIPIRPQMLRQNVNSGHAAAVRVRSNIVGDLGFWFLCNIYC